VPQGRNFDTDLAALFLQSYGEALRAARLLQVSIRRTDALFPLSGSALNNLDDESLERLDAFRVRYAQFQDLLANKLFRNLLRLEEEPPGSMLDMLNAMEKRCIITSFEDWKILRELRNTFMHDYPDEVALRAAALTRAHSLGIELCQILGRLRTYAIDHIGLAESDLAELPL
jgi:hypothetical protein